MRTTATVMVMALLATIGSSRSMIAQRPGQEFSAEMYDSSTHTNSRIYIGKSRIRLDAGGTSSVILDPDQSRGWVLMPQSHTYAEIANWPQNPSPLLRLPNPTQPCDELTKVAMRGPNGGAVNCRGLGPDTINGRAAQKWEARAAGETAYIWVDPGLGCIVKLEGAGLGFELKNVREGTQPAALFEVPADYKKVDIGGPAGTAATGRR